MMCCKIHSTVQMKNTQNKRYVDFVANECERVVKGVVT